MERKTKVALILLLCLIAALVIVYFVFFWGGGGAKSCAKDYVLSELGDGTVECYTEDEANICYIIYKQDDDVIGEIWIYCYPQGRELYKGYTIKVEPDQMMSSNKVVVFLRGGTEFRRKACDLYNQKYGFHCTPFERREK